MTLEARRAAALRAAMDANNLRVIDVASLTGLGMPMIYRILRGDAIRPRRVTENVLRLVPGYEEHLNAA